MEGRGRNKFNFYLQKLGYIEIPAIQKVLICGDTGIGAMAELDSIVGRVDDYFDKSDT